MGARMTGDHPLTGVGPDMIKVVYHKYRMPDAVNLNNTHLHNVPMQIAAERGGPALVLWLVFIGLAARDAWRQTQRGPAPAVAAVGLTPRDSGSSLDCQPTQFHVKNELRLPSASKRFQTKPCLECRKRRS